MAEEEQLSRDFNAGDILFREGEIATHLFVVQSGRVRLSRQEEGGRDTELAQAHTSRFKGLETRAQAACQRP